MNEPFSLIIPEIEQYAIDAEKIFPNFYRISIDGTNFHKIAHFIAQHGFNLRSILNHTNQNKNKKNSELQYFFSKIHDKRDYRLIICFYISENDPLISIKDEFLNAEPMEEKIMKELKFGE